MTDEKTLLSEEHQTPEPASEEQSVEKIEAKETESSPESQKLGEMDALLTMMEGYKEEIASLKAQNNKIGTKITKQTEQKPDRMDQLFSMFDNVVKSQIIKGELDEDNPLTNHIKDEIKNMTAGDAKTYIDNSKKFFDKMKESAMISTGTFTPKAPKTKDELDKIALCDSLFPDMSAPTRPKW